MRVTIEHREEAAGVSRTRRNYYVDCTVQFSEEERAIIKARHLHDHDFAIDAAEPLPSTTAFVGSGVLRVIGRFLILGAIGLGLYSGFAKTRGEGLSEFMLFLGIGLEVYGWRAGRKQEKRLENDEQRIRIRELLSKGRFSVYAPDPASATVVEEDIRSRLAAMKAIIEGSAEIKSKRTFEL